MKDAIGKVIHYYDKIGVAVVKLNKGLKLGDKVKFMHDDESFEQVIESIQVDHAAVNEVASGVEAAIKVDKPVKDNWQIYPI